MLEMKVRLRSNSCFLESRSMPAGDHITSQFKFTVQLGVSLLVPYPGRPDNLIDLGIARLPSKLGDGFFTACNQKCRIAGSAWAKFHWDRVACHPANAVDDLFDSEPGPVAQVINEAVLSRLIRFKRFKSKQMRIGQVADVNIVTHAGSIMSRVVVAKDLDVRAASQGYIQNQRY